MVTAFLAATEIVASARIRAFDVVQVTPFRSLFTSGASADNSNCGMEFFTDSAIRSLLANSLQTAVLGADGFSDVGPGPGSKTGDFINWLTISDQRQSVVGFPLMASSTRWRQVN